MNTYKYTVCICNYNTTDLTNLCISSFYNTNNKDSYRIVVLDNSDIDRYVQYDNSIIVLDNTKLKFINFNSIFNLSPFTMMKSNGNNFGSLKHAISILFLLNICQTEKLILFDSDVIVHKELDFINDDENITIADLLQNNTYAYEDELRKNTLYTSKTRFLPYLQFFNLRLMHQHNIKYFDFSRIHGILAPNNGNYYDTGASFYEDCINNQLKFKRINYHDYITHLGQGSWKNAFNKTYKKHE